jgi:hypothetical protein
LNILVLKFSNGRRETKKKKSELNGSKHHRNKIKQIIMFSFMPTFLYNNIGLTERSSVERHPTLTWTSLRPVSYISVCLSLHLCLMNGYVPVVYANRSLWLQNTTVRIYLPKREDDATLNKTTRILV